MKTFSGRFDARRNSYLLPTLGGSFIALIAVFILRYSYVWVVLVTAGLGVFVLSLAAKDFKNYWLAVFVLVLPLEIKKMLVDSEPVLAFISRYGFPIGELPGPVLYLSDLPFLVLITHWFFELIFRKQKIFFPKSNWLALAFIGWSGISLINTTVFSLGFFDLLRMVKFYFLYLYMANNVRSKETVRTMMKFLLIGMILQGLLCLSQYLVQDIRYMFAKFSGGEDSSILMKKIEPIFDITEEGNIGIRASGTVGLHNAEAQYFEFLIPIAFLLWLTTPKFRRFCFPFLGFLCGLVGLIVTFSRGGFLGAAAGLLLVLLLSKKFQLITSRKLLTILLLGVSLSIVIAPMIYSFIMTRPEGALGRIHLAKVGLEMVKTHPILGVGLNNHIIAKPEYDTQSYVLPMPTHNYYIIIASEIGIPGLLFFLGFLGLTILLAFRAGRCNDPYLASVAVGIIGAFVAIGLHITVDILGSHTNMTLLWLHAGLAPAIGQVGAAHENRTN